MKIFVYEAVTGGAMVRQDPPAALVYEADLMVQALLADLGELAGISLITTRDERLPVVEGIETVVVDRMHDPLAAFDRCLALADAAWVIAPETGGELERLSRRVLDGGRLLLGSHPDAVAIASSKRATVETLTATGVPVVPTFTAADELPQLPGRWVVKPDDGAGSEDTVRVADAAAAHELLRAGAGRLVAQPWIDGESLSLSLLCHQGLALLASVNRQETRFAEGGRLSLAGITVNAVTDADGHFTALADQVAAAMPGLHGWCGVDLIRGAGAITVLEVNPRLTTSYAGLHAALNLNPAGLMLDLLRLGQLPVLELPAESQPHHLDLGLTHAA